MWSVLINHQIPTTQSDMANNSMEKYDYKEILSWSTTCPANSPDLPQNFQNNTAEEESISRRTYH